MSVILPEGTPRSRARRLALRLRASNSRLRRRPGWANAVILLTFVIVDNFHFVGITVMELKANSLTRIDAHCPLLLSITLQFVKSDPFQRTEIVERFSHV